MSLLFTDACLIDPEAGSETPGWLLVQGGVIHATGSTERAPKADAEVSCGGACLAPGIVDFGVTPGAFMNTVQAAAAGGITSMITRPDPQIPTDTPELLAALAAPKECAALVNVLPMGALTKGYAGQELAEIGLMQAAGAVAFGDGQRAVENTGVFANALTYARSLNALVVGHPQDHGLSRGAVATSGKFAYLKGLSSVPSMAERMGLERDIALVELTGAAYHADQITTACALPALQRAKREGLDITAGTSIHHLTLNELDVAAYRTSYKFVPPLRSEDDRQAIIAALRDGVIDMISSMHVSHDETAKSRRFDQAPNGGAALETLLPAALRLVHSGDLSMPRLFRALALNPALRLGLPSGRLTPGAPADLVLFNPNTPFIVKRAALRMNTSVTPFDGARMQGKVMKTYVAGHPVYEAP